MTQTAALFDTSSDTSDTLPLGNSAFEATGFEIGWDHAHYRLVPPAEHLHAGHPVRQGWQAGQAVFGPRTLRATPSVRQWLQLRLEAWLRGHAFEGVQVTPNFLKQIDVPVCPVTREPLTQGASRPSDATIQRVFEGAGFAAGNLAVMSVQAAALKKQRGWHDALALARQLENTPPADPSALDAAAWQRLAVLMSFATPLDHAQLAGLPLFVLPPNRVRLLNPLQALQVLLTLQFTRAGFGRRVAELAAVMPRGAVRDAFQVFMHTLLARRVAAGPQLAGAELRRAMEDAWTHPLVQRRWERLALQLTAQQCERVVQQACRRGLAGNDCRWLPSAVATEGWALETRGAAASDTPAGASSGDTVDASVLARRSHRSTVTLRATQAALFA
jgi:hypothetical protein